MCLHHEVPGTQVRVERVTRIRRKTKTLEEEYETIPKTKTLEEKHID
jgi:hypothetical protein